MRAAADSVVSALFCYDRAMALITCAKCGRQLDTAGAKPGMVVTCPTCSNQLRVPGRNPLIWVAIIGAGLFGMCFCGGILSAIAIPNFLKFQAKAKQTECKTNLKAAYAAEQAYHQEHGGYTSSLAELGWSPPRGNRYAYFLGEGPYDERTGNEPPPVGSIGAGVDRQKFPQQAEIGNDPALFGVSPGLTGDCPECEIAIVCAANIDTDAALDVWVITTGPIEDAQGRKIPPGEPYAVSNDVDAR